MYNDPTIAEFKDYFARDFPYGPDLSNVRDSDIAKALAMCGVNFNPGLFANQGNYTIGFLLLTAHYLVMNLRSSSQGISGQYQWLVSSKGVGSVSEGISIPERISANPEFAMLSQTNYGAQFLMLVLPQLSGQIFTIAGRTHA